MNKTEKITTKSHPCKTELIPLKIHAICFDLGYDIEISRIMCYIYPSISSKL